MTEQDERPESGPEPTRTAALARLAAFAPRAGRAYAAGRNHDLPDRGHPHVSGLSPWLRHRIVTEQEVLQTVLGRHSPAAAEKFVQEVFWRTYWKGWLEQRPAVWTAYRAGLRHGRDRLAVESGLRRDWEAACTGATGIDGFDHWARELAATGYLHNHARMWFASIWIFTLRLPWELGADLFLRHLLDGDPASNTLSWRWVAGLQTRGKTYLARPDNIARHTEGRFRPSGLATEAAPLEGPAPPPPVALPVDERPDASRRTGWLLTEEDLSPGFALEDGPRGPALTLSAAAGRSPLVVAPQVTRFTDALIGDMAARHGDRFDGIGPAGPDGAASVLDWAERHDLRQIAMPYAPVGPAADLVAALRPALDARDIRLVRRLRACDAAAWPHATQGFFRFREQIPQLLGRMRGLRAA
jgi:deoxyribodipyrimidine photo-lyase